MGSVGQLNSAEGIISLLDDDTSSQSFALQKLDSMVNEFWPEIADSIGKIEKLVENKQFAARKNAALLASKVFYHLEQYPQSMEFALEAEELFDVNQASEFVDTLIAKFIDEYIRLRLIQFEQKPEDPVKIDPRLENIVLGMFSRAFTEKKFKQALGIAIEIRRLDKIEHAISNSNDIPAMLNYAEKASMDLVSSRDFRHQILRLLVKLYQKAATPDYLRMSEILTTLDDPAGVAEIISELIKKGDNKSALVAFQLSFDLVNNATQQFRGTVRKILKSSDPRPTPQATAPQTQDDDMPSLVDETDVKETTPMITKPQSTKPTPAAESTPVEDLPSKIDKILTGEVTIELNLGFLFKNNKTDLQILKNLKTWTEGRSSLLQTGTLFANALTHAGTTSDQFLRENYDWLKKATNWSKFSAVAGMGVIHKGQLKDGKKLLGPYLPGSGSPYSEGGSLFALGLIHANHGQEIIPYISEQLGKATGNEILQHGASLGLGVAAMATQDNEIYESLKNVVYMDSAVAGEAAGLAMGLVMLGSANPKAIEDMFTYAHETAHEKCIRGLSIGLSLIMYGREEQADTLIEQMTLDKDPILRYGAMFTIAMAYAGTANNSAIRRLLHVAVSDVSDDVRRAAVIALGFLLFKTPEKCPTVVSLLAESFNPHVRYGSALALGISCAGTGNREAIELLEPLAKDTVDYVRQGALIALSMIVVQQSVAKEPKVEKIRKLLEEKVSDKHEEAMCKFGSLISHGLIDCGGRNCTISLRSRSGHSNMSAIVGLAIFTQFWYWHPLAYFASLAFTPTHFIGLNSKLEMPVYSFKSNAKPSLFAYPPLYKQKEEEKLEKVSTAVLSVTKKKEQRDKKKKEDQMEEEEEINKKEEENKKKNEEDKKKKNEEEKEPEFEIKENPARILPSQTRYLTFDHNPRYELIKTREVGGVIMLRDLKPNEEEKTISFKSGGSASSSTTAPSNEPEAPMPEPFEYDPDKE